MDLLAKILWNPFISLVYLEVGVLFLLLTGAVAWRRSFRVFRSVFGARGLEGRGRQVSHTKAFLSSIAANVGVGNLAGVGTAIHLGGPGALFWMWMSALLGMSFRMTSTYMAIKHRPADVRSPLFATPMTYLEKYMKGRWGWIPPTVAGLILVKGVIASNLIQANSVAHAVRDGMGYSNWLVAAALSLLVGLVIIGGLKRIVDFGSAIAPWMVLVYVGTGCLLLFSDPLRTAKAVGLVFSGVVSPASAAGGIAGYTVLQAMQFGVSRGVFSHMSGIGESPFLQAANVDHPSRGAMMAAVTPFVDTIIICSITGLVIVSGSLWGDDTGAHLTVQSFLSGLGEKGRVVATLCLVVFACTTIISYAHFSERCFEYLGGKNVRAFRWAFLGTTFVGPFFPVAFVWSLGDVVIGLLIVLHLLPMLYVLLRHRSEMLKDLESDEPAPSGLAAPQRQSAGVVP